MPTRSWMPNRTGRTILSCCRSAVTTRSSGFAAVREQNGFRNPVRSRSCDRTCETPSTFADERIAAHGIEVINWIAVRGELYRDHNSDMEQKVMGVIAEHAPGLGFVTSDWMYANGLYPDISTRLVRDEEPPAHD